MSATLKDYKKVIELNDNDKKAIKQKIKELRGTLDMIEWCIEEQEYSLELYSEDIIPQAIELDKLLKK